MVIGGRIRQERYLTERILVQCPWNNVGLSRGAYRADARKKHTAIFEDMSSFSDVADADSHKREPGRITRTLY